MIRKGVIAVLTLAAVAFAVGSLTGNDLGSPCFYEIKPSRGRRVEVDMSPQHFGLHYSIQDDAPKPEFYKGWDNGWKVLGFGRFHDRSLSQGLYEGTRYSVWCPPAVPVLILGAYPAIAFFRGPMRRWHRRRTGLCLTCGYSLTGNVSGVCPECGTKIKTVPKPASG